MHIDDRLDTVLRASVTGENAALTQFRQLVDLLGRLPANASGPLVEQGFERLDALCRRLPARNRGAILRDPALRQRNPRLVATLADHEPEVASAALAVAQMDDAQWQALIPRLPVRARGLLRHRKDLGRGPTALLARLGVGDLVLPSPQAIEADATGILDLADFREDSLAPASPAAESSSAPIHYAPSQNHAPDEIAKLLRRIAEYQKSRGKNEGLAASEAPPLPMAELQDTQNCAQLRAFDFATDASGRVTWADPAAAAMIVGARLSGQDMEAPLQLDPASQGRMRQRLPLNAGRIRIEGAPAISGLWQIDAAPHFAAAGGRFTGYCGRLRRPAPEAAAPRSLQGERIRELLHELRTPVNAIQGFAEIIQQQLFGPSPHEYRAVAASIAGDSAKLLAGFEELDRLARLESGALELEETGCDLVSCLERTIAQLQPYCSSRSASLSLKASPGIPPAALGAEDCARLVWRLIATLASATTPGEGLEIEASIEPGLLRVRMDLPVAMAGRESIFTASVSQAPQALSAGMFGSGFALRLARAECRAAGGDLVHDAENLILTLQAYAGASSSKGGQDHDASGEVHIA